MIDYFDKVKQAINTIDYDVVERVIQKLLRIENHCPMLFFGNGGSAAIANHAVADFTKGIYEDNPQFTCPAISFCTNSPLMTAISNDIHHHEVFDRQLKYLNLPKADVVAISSSGKSMNVVYGLETAKEMGYYTVALVGFDGGYILENNIADDIIHVKSDNYGVIEDCHMMILHCIAQEIRKRTSDNPNNLKL